MANGSSCGKGGETARSGVSATARTSYHKGADTIDDALEHGCKDFDSFLAAMKAAGVEIKQGKHLAFKISSGKRFMRCNSLGDDYSEAAIMERLSSGRVVSSKEKTASTKPNMLIDIQARMRQINFPGFERWAQIFNIKEMAKTMFYL